MSFDHALEGALAALRDGGNLRVPRTIEALGGGWVRIEGRDVLGLCSNDYLGLAADDPRAPIPEGATNGLRAVSGSERGAAASRLVSGTRPIHRQAEGALAAFTRTDASLLFSSGYAANVSCIPAIAEAGDLLLSDSSNHASLIDGCRLSRADTIIFPHLDLPTLQERLTELAPRYRRTWIVTEAIFSMDGDVAPLSDLRRLADQHRAFLYVDEAHSLGIRGPEGSGLCAEERVRPEVFIGTLGKAFGLAGAFASGSTHLIRWLENRARGFVFSTASPPHQAAEILVAIDRVRHADAARAQLLSHTTRLRSALAHLPFALVGGDNSAILSVIVGDPHQVMAFTDQLLERGVFVQGIRAPTVPPGTERLRIVPSAAHSAQDIDAAIETLVSVLEAPP
ncbi:MAG: 8-amino-7-oxononanoate synthase [Myxococcales bacterium]|nr:8-amino-7-oxononanoate synthase [Myxococcales bacterium]